MFIDFNVPFWADIFFRYTFTGMLWHFTLWVTHTMVQHASGTFHSRCIFETSLKAIGRKFTSSISVEFFREKLLAVSKYDDFFYHYSYIIMDNKSLNQIRIEWVCEQFQYVCTTCTSYCFWRKHKTYSDTLNSIIRPFEKFKPTCSALVSCALALYVIVELHQSNMVFWY